MGYHKSFSGLVDLPEVQELKKLFTKRKYNLYWCDDSGLRMQKKFTEIHFIPETDRLRLCIHDDGMGEKETDMVLKLASEIVLKHGYRQGSNVMGIHIGLNEREHEYYKYF